MHGQRHRFRVDKGTQILVIMETCMAFVLIGVAEPEYLPEREKIGFQLDRCIFRWCTDAKVCFTTVAVQDLPYYGGRCGQGMGQLHRHNTVTHHGRIQSKRIA
ncbi:hypothetical protein TcCL_NonESM08590 [Trypanosoma cruzi]|nr:hypothetical protein TcCL_NonESM08590 [Trypanosoma cruzi]